MNEFNAKNESQLNPDGREELSLLKAGFAEAVRQAINVSRTNIEFCDQVIDYLTQFVFDRQSGLRARFAMLRPAIEVVGEDITENGVPVDDAINEFFVREDVQQLLSE